MYGVLLQNLLEQRHTMLALSMIVANLRGYICSSTSLKYSKSFMISKILLKGCSAARFLLYKQIGVESMRNLTPFFFQKVGITHLVSCSHAHQQNGAVEQSVMWSSMSKSSHSPHILVHLVVSRGTPYSFIFTHKS